jgi:hypothetical protein
MPIHHKCSQSQDNASISFSVAARLNRSKVIHSPFISKLCQLALVVVVPLAFNYGTATSAKAATLWYNGDPDGQGATGNAINIYPPFTYIGARLTQYVLDDFIIPSTDEGWNINSLWSNNLLEAPNQLSGVAWSIEKILPRNIPGERPYNSETVASGVSPATIIPTDFTVSGSNYSVYTVKASGLNINLSSGTYWLSVAPQYILPTDPEGGIPSASFSAIATTKGTNAVGTPPGNDGMSFRINYESAFEPGNAENSDYSMGIEGEVVPEPSSILSLLTFGGLTFGFRRSRNQKLTPDANDRATNWD